MMNLPKPAERSREQGFTLIELLIVVAIIGILAAIAIPQFGQYRQSAAKGAFESDLRTCLSEAMSTYATDPTGDSDVDAWDGEKYNCVTAGAVRDDEGLTAEFSEFDSDLEINASTDSYDGINFDETVNCAMEDGGRRLNCFYGDAPEEG